MKFYMRPFLRNSSLNNNITQLNTMKLIQTLTIAATLAVTNGFSSQPSVVSRRDAVTNTLASIVAISLPSSQAANAIDACPKGSKNCIRQTWTPPSSTSASDATSQLRDALAQYPQEGQEDGKVDGGGYTIISDTLDKADGSLALEYKSGKGTFAKMFNGGRPFVDDLIIEPNIKVVII